VGARAGGAGVRVRLCLGRVRWPGIGGVFGGNTGRGDEGAMDVAVLRDALWSFAAYYCT